MYLQKLQTVAQRIGSSSKEYYTLLKSKVQLQHIDTAPEGEVKEHLSERNLLKSLLWISLLAFFLKAVTYSSIRKYLTTPWTLATAIVSLPGLAWNFSVATATDIYIASCSLSWLAMPMLCGVIMGVVTWVTVFFDSFVPGVFPPSSSPRKFGLENFHLGHIVAVLNICAFALLLYFGE